jgi:hypothetical protein
MTKKPSIGLKPAFPTRSSRDPPCAGHADRFRAMVAIAGHSGGTVLCRCKALISEFRQGSPSVPERAGAITGRNASMSTFHSGLATKMRIRARLLLLAAIPLAFVLSGIANAQTPGTFSPTGSMSIPRFYETATQLLNGTVLITGGSDGTMSRGRPKPTTRLAAHSARRAA